MRVVRGKRAMVTGAASGIGRAIALALATEGASLFLLDIDREGLEGVARAARDRGVDAIAAVCDLADPAQISAAVNALRAAWGGLDILVNNAGIAYYGPTHLMSAEQWDRILAVNLMAPIQLVRELLPLLLAAEDAHVLNVCSILGLVPWPKAAAYQTTKFGLVGFTAALRAEYCRDNFGVTALCPGLVQSALLESAAIGERDRRPAVPAWVCASAEKTAAAAVRAIRENRGTVLVTPAAHLYWRLTRFCPGLVDWLIREGWRRRGKVAA